MYYYEKDNRCSLVVIDGSCIALQKEFPQSFKFLSDVEDFVSSSDNNLTLVAVGQSRVYFFGLKGREGIRVSMMMKNSGLSRTVMMVTVLDDANTLSSDERKDIGQTFAKALNYYLTNTFAGRHRRDKISSNGCAITFGIIVLLALFFINLNR